MKKSISPLTNKSYEIPREPSDKARIDEFLSLNHNKKIIVVQGLGFVGAVMAIVCANANDGDYAVIGVDRLSEATFWKIESLNEGVFPLIAEDPSINELYERALENKNFLATYDPYAFSAASTIVVDINLDVVKHSDSRHALSSYEVSLTSFEAAIRTISEHCRADCLVLVETTVPPGTCKNVVAPVIREGLSKRGLSTGEIRVGHSYERVMPGPHYVKSIREFPRVYSGIDQPSADAIEAFLSTIIDTRVCALTRLESTNATEMCKVLENSYRATNISFMIEWSRFAEAAGVNLFEMVKAIRVRETHANLMFPGLGVGGYCLTKDPLLASWASKHFFGLEEGLSMSEGAVSLNDQMPRFASRRLEEVFGPLQNRRIAILGVAYRGDVGDTRFTPVGPLMVYLKEVASVFLHDFYVSYWEEFDLRIETDIDKIFRDDKPDLIVFGAGHSKYTTDAFVNKLLQLSPLQIFDPLGIYTEDQVASISARHDLKVLGRGDL